MKWGRKPARSSESDLLGEIAEGVHGIEAVFDEGALDRIAELAAEEGTGARGLLTVCERLPWLGFPS